MFSLTKDLEVGVEAIDAQHRELIDRINTITRAGHMAFTKEETQRTIELLGKYIIKHFNDEEALQRRVNFPNYDWHKTQHQYYMNEFKVLKQEFDENGYSAKFTLTLSKSMIDWLVKHIKSADAELGKFIKSQK